MELIIRIKLNPDAEKSIINYINIKHFKRQANNERNNAKYQP